MAKCKSTSQQISPRTLVGDTLEQKTLRKKALKLYYDELLELVNTAARIDHMIDLGDRVMSEQSSRKELRRFRRKYHDNLNDLDGAIYQQKQRFIGCLDQILEYGQKLGIAERPADLNDYAESLVQLLKDPARRGKYRALAKCYWIRGNYASLDMLEYDFQRLPKPA